MWEENLLLLQDTLRILERGSYRLNDRNIQLQLDSHEMKMADVYLPEDIQSIKMYNVEKRNGFFGSGSFGCENIDSFTMARHIQEKYVQTPNQNTAKPVLVLNFANPVNPGGGVRRGARAQEEDLCRKSSLLLSLEGESASVYYRYNRALDTYMGSDALIIHPQVEIIRDTQGRLLEQTVVTAVMTCAAPMLCYGLQGLTENQYRGMLYGRIKGMLNVAAYLGYRYLVLGAFGCGAFQNDAKTVAELFYQALEERVSEGIKCRNWFHRIDFAVLDRSAEKYNYQAFSRFFAE